MRVYLSSLNCRSRRVRTTAVLMRVRQRGKYPIWRVSHPFDDEVAVRLIVWFPDGDAAGVVVAFGGDKKKIGDAFYIRCGVAC